MKTLSLVKTLSLSALVALSLNTGLAQADDSSCLLGAFTQTVAPGVNTAEAGSQAMMNSMEARLNQQLERIEQGLRNGQISPKQAGRMMREQWEAVQFQRGFLEGSKSAESGHNNVGRGEACGLIQGVDTKQLAAKLVPVVSRMAAEGMQTATTVMRAVAHEAAQLIREQAPQDERF